MTAADADFPAASFPPGFVWGAATAAYQVEGAVAEDGRGPSIWDTFSHTPGRVRNGDTGDVAVDHYHRYREDVALMRDLGLGGYRFSLAWPRLQPTGSGPVNRAGLDFYSRLVDELLEAGIEPWVTLYHWDLPQPLEDAGGWPARDTVDRFTDYALLALDALGDRVRFWTTFNEPWCTAFLGYASGVHAPGRTDPAAALTTVRHLLLAHGQATRALRSAGAEQVGITLNLYAVSAASPTPADQDARRRIDALSNRLFLEPLVDGRWPADLLADLEPAGLADALVGPTPEADLATIAAPLDLLGINYYSRHTVAGDGTPGQAPEYPGSTHVRFTNPGYPTTHLDWPVDPAGLTEVLTWVADRAPGLPLYVTENGACYADQVLDGGRVADWDRIAYLAGHLGACAAALDRGVPLRGYFAWSLLDNFEWAWGYEKRFGLVHVDYDTLARTPKLSADWYAARIREAEAAQR